MRGREVAVAVLVSALALSRVEAQGPSPLSNKKFIQGLLGLNATNVSSIVYSGTAITVFPGDKPGAPAGPTTSFLVAISYGHGARKVELGRAAGSPRQAALFTIEGFAWNVMDKGKPVAQAGMAAEHQREIAMTPHGIFKAAQERTANAVVADQPGPDGKPRTTITFTSGGSRFKATMTEAAVIERVETMAGDPVLGNTVIEVAYADYKEFDGIKFPTKIVQKRGGQTVLDLSVTSVTPNAGFYVEVPAAVRSAKK